MNAIGKNWLLAAATVTALGAVGCGGSLTPGSGTGGSPGTGGIPGSGGIVGAGGLLGSGGELGAGGSTGAGGAPALCLKPAAGEVPSEHRATAVACKPSATPPPPDAGLQSCTTSADCASDGFSFFSNCLRGQCSFDACLTDGDCGADSVCACSSDYYGGNAAYHPNLCVPASCHTDGDCGANGYCSPSRGYCGTFQGFYCHRSADSCVDPTKDCQSCGLNACTYSPAVGAFTCGSQICAG